MSWKDKFPKENRYYETKNGILYHGDCLDIMKDFPDESVDLILTDPPYNGIVSAEWDNKWKTMDNFINWLEERSIEMKRVMKWNGSFYMFSDDFVSAYVQVMLDKHLIFLNHLIWFKPNNITVKYTHNQRKYCPVSERILFYAKYDATGLLRVKHDVNNFHNLRKYFYDMLQYIGKTRNEINDTLGHRKAEHAFYVNPKKAVLDEIGGKADHYFRYGSAQWDLPTKETYDELIRAFKIDEWEGFREYESLREEYESLREEYESLREEYERERRLFNYQTGVYEVITLPIITKKENTDHPTTKPLRIIETLEKVSSKPEQIILDPFLGSGTTAVASERLNRRWIGIEKEEEYCELAKKRIKDSVNVRKLDLFTTLP